MLVATIWRGGPTEMGGLNGFRESIWLQSSFPFEGPSKTLIFREQRGILVATRIKMSPITIDPNTPTTSIYGKNARCMKRFGEGVGANPILHRWVRIKKSYDQHLKKAKNPWLYHSPEEHGLRFLFGWARWGHKLSTETWRLNAQEVFSGYTAENRKP